jgi:hypothetical protein
MRISPTISTRILVLAAMGLAACSTFQRLDSPEEPDDGDVALRDAGGGSGDAEAVDTGNNDGGPPADLGPRDAGSPDSGMPDGTTSTVCGTPVIGNELGTITPRIRLASDGTRIVAGWVHDRNAGLEVQNWTDPGAEGAQWADLQVATTDTLPIYDEVDQFQVGDVTGVGVAFIDGTFHWVVTRQTAEPCAFVEAATGSPETRASVGDCGGATVFGAEISNRRGMSPEYVWLDTGSSALSTLEDPFGPDDQLYAPWCAKREGSCQPLDFNSKADLRDTGGPHVLVADPAGRAYLWDTVQTTVSRSSDCGAADPVEPPRPLVADGQFVLFDNVDVLYFNGEYRAVRQTADSVEIRAIDRSGEFVELTGEPEEVHAHDGIKPFFDADLDTETGRIAAVTAEGMTVELFAFDAENIEQPPELSRNVQEAAVIVDGDAVAVVVISGNRKSFITEPGWN